jgi:hypothetical protein
VKSNEKDALQYLVLQYSTVRYFSVGRRVMMKNELYSSTYTTSTLPRRADRYPMYYGTLQYNYTTGSTIIVAVVCNVGTAP